MGEEKPCRCKFCRRKSDFISARGFCFDCGIKKQLTNTRSLRMKSGKPYKKWVLGIKNALEAMEAEA